MGIKITNTRQAVKVQASQKNRAMMGKKVLELGKEYTLLFPKKDNEVVVSGIIGRSCDYKSLGISFGRIMDDQMELNEDTQRITDKSGMNKWARLSNILYKAAMAKEIKDKEDEATALAAKTGTSVDEAALNQAIAKVILAYEGQRKVGDEAAIMPTKQRLLSSRVDFSIFTEAVLIPLDRQLQPEYDKARAVEVRLSTTKQKQINDILDSEIYNDMNDPDGFLEVKFAYKGADAKEAGKAPYQGLEKAIRKIDLSKDENGEYIDHNVKSIENLIKDTTHDPEIMYSRSGTVSFAQTSADVEAAMRKFLANNRLLSTYIDMDDEATKRAAKDIIDLNVFGTGTTQYSQLLKMVEEQTASEEETTLDAGVQDLMNAKGTKEVGKIVDGNEELSAMVDTDEIDNI